MPVNAHPDSTFSSHVHNDWTQLQLNNEEYPQPDIRGPMPVNAHPDSTFSSHVHNDWTQLQLGEYPQPDIRGPMPVNAHPDSTFSSHVHNDWTQLQLGEYPQPDIRGPMPVNAHPDSTFSSHVHNDWTQLQIGAEEASKIVMSWPSVARCSPDEIPSDEWACDHSNEMRRHRHDGTVGQDLEPEAPASTTSVQLSYRPMIKCKDPDYGNPITCDLDDVTDANDDHVKDIWNMTPVKTVIGGPKVSNEPPAEPVAEVDAGKAAAGKGGSKAAPDIRAE